MTAESIADVIPQHKQLKIGTGNMKKQINLINENKDLKIMDGIIILHKVKGTYVRTPPFRLFGQTWERAIT